MEFNYRRALPKHAPHKGSIKIGHFLVNFRVNFVKTISFAYMQRAFLSLADDVTPQRPSIIDLRRSTVRNERGQLNKGQ